MSSRVSLQPPYSFILERYSTIMDVVPMSKDKLTRGWYFLNKKMVEDPTTFQGMLTHEPNLTKYMEIEKM